MAERFNKEHDERTRKKIQVSQIINRLTKHIDGECEMTTTQVRAAEILLKKALPDLSQTDLTSGGEKVNFLINNA